MHLLLGTTVADVKTWTKNTNFDDPANWNGGGVFCSNDKKMFPKELVASIFVQKNESLQELVSVCIEVPNFDKILGLVLDGVE